MISKTITRVLFKTHTTTYRQRSSPER